MFAFGTGQRLTDEMLMPHYNSAGTIWASKSKRLQEMNNPFWGFVNS
jgi:hypothetical protein